MALVKIAPGPSFVLAISDTVGTGSHAKISMNAFKILMSVMIMHFAPILTVPTPVNVKRVTKVAAKIVSTLTSANKTLTIVARMRIVLTMTALSHVLVKLAIRKRCRNRVNSNYKFHFSLESPLYPTEVLTSTPLRTVRYAHLSIPPRDNDFNIIFILTIFWVGISYLGLLQNPYRMWILSLRIPENITLIETFIIHSHSCCHLFPRVMACNVLILTNAKKISTLVMSTLNVLTLLAPSHACVIVVS